MAIKPATPELLREMAQVILDGRMKTMLVTQNANKGKGKVYAEYTTHETSQTPAGVLDANTDDRIFAAETLTELADKLQAGVKFNNVYICKLEPDIEWYHYQISVAEAE